MGHKSDGNCMSSTSDNFVIALAGNPNVGKSTLFNALTGLNQHTGNWPGKTVSTAKGHFSYQEKNFTLVDLPGTYSLMASSVEEEVARDFICFGQPNAIVVIVDATCLERNLNLVLQILEIRKEVVVAVNLLDEARKKKIKIDLEKLSKLLGVPAIGITARSGEGIEALKQTLNELVEEKLPLDSIRKPIYNENIEEALAVLEPTIDCLVKDQVDSRWLSLKLLDLDPCLHKTLTTFLGFDLLANQEVTLSLDEAKACLCTHRDGDFALRDTIVSTIVQIAERLYHQCTSLENKAYHQRDRRLDHLLTSKATGIPLMLLLLGVIFWLTIVGANYPSSVLYDFLFSLETPLLNLLHWLHLPEFIINMFVFGMFRTLAWVVAVMLPPMAIFFPLFTLLEDSGYLPRIAFNMDKFFKKAGAHGKQSLTMCMGFGCNACGVTGCRIIDSPRERLIAILTNNFVPCNGRFPTLIAIITIFLAGTSAHATFLATLVLLLIIILGVGLTLLISKLLSLTILKGIPSTFALELPPYRRPQIGKVIIRSIFDRTLFILGRAVSVAAPAGIVIWIFSNLYIGDSSLLTYCTQFLDPFAKYLGLDGMILMAFILSFPANELIIPLILMGYMSTGKLTDYNSLDELRTLLVNHGWTTLTAINVLLFTLLHYPCATTCLTIKKETQGFKWTLLAFIIPTLTGLLACFLVTLLAKGIHYIAPFL